MSSEYRNLCDFCGKETKGYCDSSHTDKELARNNWDVQVDNMWWEDSDEVGLKEMKKEHEFNKDACFDCAKGAGEVLREYFKKKQEGK